MARPYPNVRIIESGKQFDEQVRRTTGNALIRIVNQHATTTFGKDAILDPTDRPAFGLDKPVFGVRAWHETGIGTRRGTLQEQNFSFTIELGNHMLLAAIENDDPPIKYELSTYEAHIFHTIGMGVLLLDTQPKDED